MSITIASWLLTIGMITVFVLYPPRRRYRAPRNPGGPRWEPSATPRSFRGTVLSVTIGLSLAAIGFLILSSH